MSSLAPTILPQWFRTRIPASLKPRLRDAICAAADAWDVLRRRRDPVTAPARLRVRVGCFASFIHIDRYRAVGAEFADHLIRLAGLVPASRLLDVGCGCGQIAAAVLPILGDSGMYRGFDPDAEAIAWCDAHITTRAAAFRFERVDVGNSLYNPSGRVAPEAFRFPYADGEFDVVILKSLFTHMPYPQMAQYLCEVGRVLQPGGRCLASFYLVNADATRLMGSPRSAYRFVHRGDECWILDPAAPDYVVAQDESNVRRAAAAAALDIVEPPRWGSWCGRRPHLSFQDILIFTRRAD